MYYISTRDAALRCTASQAIVQGLSRDGGLFLPERIPALEQGALEKMKTMLGNTIHQFAKRQMTWFREMERKGIKIHWVEP